MLVRIDKRERELFEKFCATFDLSCEIYTMENNEKMFQAYIMDGDRELTPFMAYCLGRTIQIEWEQIIEMDVKSKLATPQIVPPEQSGVTPTES